MVDERGTLTVADIPANTMWRIVAERSKLLVLGVHSHALVALRDSVFGTNPHPAEPISSVWRDDRRGTVSQVVPPTKNFPLGLQRCRRSR